MQIIETTFCLILSFLLYETLLRRETFFQLNRIYLLLMPLAALVVPCLQWTLQKEEVIPVISPFVERNIQTQTIVYQSFSNELPLFSLSIGEILFAIYIIVFLIKIIKLSLTLWQMSLLIKKSKKQLQQGAITLLESEMPVSSFFSYIFWNDNEKAEHQYFMLEHELVHAKQWHSADVLLMELLVALQWFNPLIYYFKNRLKEVHEFIADEYVVQKTGQSYQYAAVLVTMAQRSAVPSSVVNTFSSFTKQRLIMLTNARSSFWKAAKYVLALPLLCTFVLLFSFDLMAKIPSPLHAIEATLNNITTRTIAIDKDYNLLNNNDLGNETDEKILENIITNRTNDSSENQRFIFYWGGFQLNFEYDKNKKSQTVSSQTAMNYSDLRPLVLSLSAPYFWNGKTLDKDFSFRVSYIDSSSMEARILIVDTKEYVNDYVMNRSDRLYTFFEKLKPNQSFVIDQIKTLSTGECNLVGSILVNDDIANRRVVTKMTAEEIARKQKNDPNIGRTLENQKGKIDFKWGGINLEKVKMTAADFLESLLHQPTMFDSNGLPMDKLSLDVTFSPGKGEIIEIPIGSDISDVNVYKKTLPTLYDIALKAKVGDVIYLDNISGRIQNNAQYTFSAILEIIK